jgi:predicted O-methyltransferase YrrM
MGNTEKGRHFAKAESAMKTAWHFVRHALALDLARSQTTAAERECLARHALGRTRIAEIGVFEGLNTRLLADVSAGESEVFAIDPFQPGRVGISWTELIARREVGRSPRFRNVRFVKALSWDAAKEISGKFDFVFIDGDHSFEAITRDWIDWSTKVRAGGIVALHDTAMSTSNLNVTAYGSYKFFEATIARDPQFECVEQVDSLSIMRRY